MDKLRREAERSGDSLRHALELRRQGQDIRAKRLLQDLAWDHCEGAEAALEQIYPLNDELKDKLGSLSLGAYPCFLSIEQLLGSLDPRVAQAIIAQFPRLFIGFQIPQQLRERLRRYRKLAGERRLLPRLKSKSHWVFRLHWADPLEEELSALFNWLELEPHYRAGAEYTRHHDFLFGWKLYSLGYVELIKRWGRDLPDKTWRERMFFDVATGSHDSCSLPEESVIPNWAPKNSSLSYDQFHQGVLRSALFKHFRGRGWEPASELKNSDARQLIYVALGASIEVNPRGVFGRRERRIKAVSALQEVIGDRVICWDNDFIIPWEFGHIESLLKELIVSVAKTDKSPDFDVLEQVTFGVAPIKENWETAIETALLLCSKASEEGLTYLPECID
ncbi:MAG: hypothetical protein P1V97_16285 [Planctomycetota bacterium]|nr:hypothetical protein [Planctomycetota bacterium]